MTSENVAAKYGVSRDTQDKFAAQSHARMAAAQAAGKFDAEIVPVATKLKVCARHRAFGVHGHVRGRTRVLMWSRSRVDILCRHLQRVQPTRHVQDPKTGEEREVVIRADDGVRAGTSAAGLGKLRAVFKKDGSTTAGNSSQAPPPAPVPPLPHAPPRMHPPALIAHAHACMPRA